VKARTAFAIGAITCLFSCTPTQQHSDECTLGEQHSEDVNDMRARIKRIGRTTLQPAAPNTWASTTLLTTGPEESRDWPGVGMSAAARPVNRAGAKAATNVWIAANWSRSGCGDQLLLFDALPGGLISVPADQITATALTLSYTSGTGAYYFEGDIQHAYDTYLAPMTLTFAFSLAAGANLLIPTVPLPIETSFVINSPFVPPYATEVTVCNYSAATGGLFTLYELDGVTKTLEAPIPGSILAGAKSTFKLGSADRLFNVNNNTAGTLAGQVVFRISL